MGIAQAAAQSARRRSDAGRVRLQQRDLDGLLLIAEHYAAPYDLLAQALGITPARVRSVAARWRRAGLAATGMLGPGSAWCWLTPAGMAAAGYPCPARPPALSRLAHVRAVLAARLWLQSSPGYQAGVVAVGAAHPRRFSAAQDRDTLGSTAPPAMTRKSYQDLSLTGKPDGAADRSNGWKWPQLLLMLTW